MIGLPIFSKQIVQLEDFISLNIIFFVLQNEELNIEKTQIGNSAVETATDNDGKVSEYGCIFKVLVPDNVFIVTS